MAGSRLRGDCLLRMSRLFRSSVKFFFIKKMGHPPFLAGAPLVSFLLGGGLRDRRGRASVRRFRLRCYLQGLQRDIFSTLAALLDQVLGLERGSSRCEFRLREDHFEVVVADAIGELADYGEHA